MRSLIFFEQKRHDGTIRTGIEADGDTTLLGLIIEGPSDREDDPLGSALLWYTEIRCRGENLPTEPEEARSWLISRADVFGPTLIKLAKQVKVGWDADFPISCKDFPTLDRGFEAEFVCSAIRKLSNPALSEVIERFASEFVSKLNRLEPLEISSR